MLPLLRFLSIVLVGLALVPMGAHLLEIAHKLPMSLEEYRVVQGIYRGWALTGIVIFGAILATLALAIALRAAGRPWGLAFGAFVCLVGTQALFWAFTQPANVATANWTRFPADWDLLRTRWEYSHAASAVLGIAALAFVAGACAGTRDRR
jgi:hypothetical protein